MTAAPLGLPRAYSLCWSCASLLAPLVGPGIRQRYGSDAMWFAAAGLCAVSAAIHLVGTRRAEGPAGDSPASC